MIRFERWLNRLSPLQFVVWLLFVMWATTGCISLAYAAGVEVTAAVPATSDLSTLPAWVTALVIVVVPLVLSALASAIASGVNEVIRQRDAAGQPVSGSFRIFAAVLNAVALNLDKTRQQAAAAKAPEAKP